MINQYNPASMEDERLEIPKGNITTNTLSDDGQSAAGWLSEAISKTDKAESITLQPSISPTLPATGLATMGDAILRGMQSASQEYKKVSSEIHTSLETGNQNGFSLGATLKLHMKFIEISMEAEVVSKVVSKSTQHIDQLSKLQ